MEEITVSINIVVLLTLGIVCIIALQIAIFLDQKKIFHKHPEPKAPLPKILATKSGRVLVTTPKRKVIYNDDAKIYQQEAEKRGDDGSGGT